MENNLYFPFLLFNFGIEKQNQNDIFFCETAKMILSSVVHPFLFPILFAVNVVQPINEKYQLGQGAVSVALAIGSVLYAALNILCEYELHLRYLNWALTLPLYLYSLYQIALANGFENNFSSVLLLQTLLILSLYVIVFYPEYRMFILLLAAIFGIVLFNMVWKAVSFLRETVAIDVSDLFWFLAVIWLLYLVVHLMDSEHQCDLFNILDAVLNVIYPLAYQRKITLIP